ncbi:endoglucanase b [Colletotrichum tabaci]|uniref:lytic cellulose monooxygenase (C4-dehydrogenating) n=1 Tax=Colletotrichum tabaci TaxID=1209068 RepID=A0AAV9SSI6_9PEZI
MACGKDGQIAAAYTCAAPGGSRLTFEFRQWPDRRAEGSIDPSHKGPCAVYMKKVNDMASSAAVGPGWFKIWHEGYNESTQQWCVDQIIENKGFLDVELPSGLPAGYYLVRPELLALHQAFGLKDPQYYVGCAQIYIQSGPAGSLEIPSEYSVSIPGYIDGSEPGNAFNLYEKQHFPYPIPGPEPYNPTGASANTKSDVTFNGGVPSGCIIKNANWCGVKVKGYTSETGCWNAVEACYAQGDDCFSSAPPTGAKNCYVWNDKICKGIENQCKSKNFKGPPEINLSTMTTSIRSIVFTSTNPDDLSSALGVKSDSGFLFSTISYHYRE